MKSTQLERSKFSNSSVSYEKSKYNLDVYSKKKNNFPCFSLIGKNLARETFNKLEF